MLSGWSTKLLCGSRFFFLFFSTRTNVHGLRSSLRCLMGHVHKGSQFLGCELIKAAEQMVRTWSGHNEIVNGEANPTWHNSCVGFERWPAVGNLPGAHLQSREWDHNRLETFQWSICVSWCLLRFHHVRSFFFLFFSKSFSICLSFHSLLQSLDLSRWVFGKHQILNTCCPSQFPPYFLPTLTKAALTDTHTGKIKQNKKTHLQLWRKQSGQDQNSFFFPIPDGGEAARSIH